MSKECVIYNLTRGPVSFSVWPSFNQEELMAIPSHKRRKALQGSAIKILILRGHNKNMTEDTSLSNEDIKASPEVVKLERMDKIRLEFITVDSDEKPVVVETPVDSEPEEKEEAPVETSDEPDEEEKTVIEDLPTPEPEKVVEEPVVVETPVDSEPEPEESPKAKKTAKKSPSGKLKNKKKKK